MDSALVVERLGYLGVPLLLILGGVGVPIPEEVPIILAAVLSKSGTLFTPLAFLSCLAGVLIGDFIVYAVGYWHGERVLTLPLTRNFLSRGREAQIKGYFHRHGFKILLLGRFAVGFRTAAYLTAGILRLPAWRLLAIDLAAALLSTSLMFGLGYFYAEWITWAIHTLQHWLAILACVSAGIVALYLLVRYIQGRRRSSKIVGPPLLVEDVAPLPPSATAEHRDATPASPPPPEAAAAAPAPEPPPTPEPNPAPPPAPVAPAAPVPVAEGPAIPTPPPEPITPGT